MPFWIAASLAAALFQTIRFMLQKKLSVSTLTPTGSTFARFAYALPFIWLGTWIYLRVTDQVFPSLNIAFWGWAALGGVSQIAATICLVALFAHRNFAVGVAFAKTEVIMTVLVGLALLGEGIDLVAWGAILIGVLGVLVLSLKPDTGHGALRQLGSRAVVLGLGSGLLFAFSSVGYRGATLNVLSDDPILRGGITLACVISMQVLAMLVWMGTRDPNEISRVWAARKWAVWIGITSVCGSLGWFVAFALQTAALVKAIGQIELIFSIAASALFFKEVISRREYVGIALLLISILALIWTIS